ncbi:hypothetical protein GGI59_006333 [Rhizobium lentis]|uniref:Uncharacterized protein n=1 Tax=Rhizobium lentis TaxID=1138194 RepID=A0A7W8XKK0_9HYPH|nr:hypothetical protein [Rhizobium lentis]MBB5554017.1 hypothetical protein [Rhizobium lentis]MBB5564624.1 hypothetical protein [Rhizobium lentis]MBB5571130.1 hypothetical protein [Rhizobium lentis]
MMSQETELDTRFAFAKAIAQKAGAMRSIILKAATRW